MRSGKFLLLFLSFTISAIIYPMARFIRPMAQRLATQRVYTSGLNRFPKLSKHNIGVAQLRSQHPKFRFHQKYSRFNSRNWKKLGGGKFYGWLPSAIVVSSLAALNKQDNEQQEETTAQQKPWAELEAKYRKEFEKEEQRLMDEFFAIVEPYGITRKEWKKIDDPQMIQAYKENILNDGLKVWKSDKPLKPETIKIVKRMLKYYGLDPKDIEVFNLNEAPKNNWLEVIKGWLGLDDKTVEGAAFYKCFGLYEDRLQGKSIIELEQVIAHEIQHVIYNDNYRRVTLEIISLNLQKRAPEIKNKLDSFISKFCQFKERRADTLACLLGPHHAYARAIEMCPVHKIIYTKEDREMAIESDESKIDPKYPRDHEFALWASNIYREMMGCIPEDQRAQYEPERPNWFWQLLGY